MDFYRLWESVDCNMSFNGWLVDGVSYLVKWYVLI